MDHKPASETGARVADVVAATLHAHGLRHAFGMPGGEVVTLVDGLEAAGIRFHLARHETAAAIMAAGAAVRTDAPAALVTTLGPGLANAVNGIADAAQERVPLIVLSGIVDREQRGSYTHQIIDQAALLRPLVKASFEIAETDAGETVARAVALALCEPKGPVHIDISPAVAARPARGKPVQPPLRMELAPDPASQAVTGLAARIAAAERPLILAGFEAARDGAGPAVLRLAERIGAPVITTYKGKGLVPEDHRLSLGGAGLSPRADGLLLPLVAAADLVLAIGYDPIEMRPGWQNFAAREAIVEITALPADHGMHGAGLRIACPPGAFLEALSGHVEARRGWPEGEPAITRARLRDAFAPKADWGPGAIVECLREAADPDDIVTVDSGAHRILLSQQWVAERPLTLLQSAGFCTMAAALPLAIGAATVEPGRRVFAVMGDGGLEMGIGELATLRDLRLPVTLVVFQDQSLALIALKQAAAGLKPAGVALGETDFARVAEGFGGSGITVETRHELRSALSEARNRSGFSLIACRFDAALYHGAF